MDILPFHVTVFVLPVGAAVRRGTHWLDFLTAKQARLAVDAEKSVPAQSVAVETVAVVGRMVARVALAAFAHLPDIPSTVTGTA